MTKKTGHKPHHIFEKDCKVRWRNAVRRNREQSIYLIGRFGNGPFIVEDVFIIENVEYLRIKTKSGTADLNAIFFRRLDN